MSSYFHVLNLAQSRGKAVASKRIANNTYVELLARAAVDQAYQPVPVERWNAAEESDRAVGVRLHKTYVVTFTGDGRLVLNTGGWHTVTTKDRINTYTPNWVRVFSDKGEWRVSYRPYSEEVPSIPFADGVTLEINSLVGIAWTPVPGTYPDESQERLARESRKKLRADIADLRKKGDTALVGWRNKLQTEGALSTAGDCWYCTGIVSNTDGSPVTSNDHLWSHLRDGYVFPSLYILAYADKGFRDPRSVFAQDVTFGIGRPGEYLAKFLFKRLSASSEPQVDIIRYERYVEKAVAALEKPEDFGYFGGDEHLWHDSAPTWTKTRDSENLDLANFQVVWDALKAEFPALFPADLDEEGYPERDFNGWPAIYVFGAGHWAVGHIDQIVVPVKLDVTRPVAIDNLHPAFIRVCEFVDAANAYPTLDGAEEIAARLTAEQLEKNVRQSIEYLDDDRVTPYADQIVGWWVAAGEEDFDWFTDSVLKAHAAILEVEAYDELAAASAGQQTLL